MPPKRQTRKPRAYGRQAKGQTIKSVSLASDVAEWGEQCAAIAGTSFSEWLTTKLQDERQRLDMQARTAAALRLNEPPTGYTAAKPQPPPPSSTARCAAAARRTSFYSVTRQG